MKQDERGVAVGRCAGEELGRQRKRKQGQKRDIGCCLFAFDNGPPARPAQPWRETVTQERKKKAGSHRCWFQDQGIPEYWQDSDYGDGLRTDVGHGGSPKGNWS